MGGGETGEGTEAGFGLVQAQAETAMVLEAAKGVLDHVPGPVEGFVVGVLHQPVALGRHAGADALCSPVAAQSVGVTGLVGDHGHGLEAVGQRSSMAAVRVPARRGQ